MIDPYLEDLSEEDLALSLKGLELFGGFPVSKFRIDMKRGELFIELSNGRRLFVEGLIDKEQISIN